MQKLLFKIRNFFVPYPRYRIIEKIVNFTNESGNGIANEDPNFETITKRKFVVEEKMKSGYYVVRCFHTLKAAEDYIKTDIKEQEEEILRIYNYK